MGKYKFEFGFWVMLVEVDYKFVWDDMFMILDL